MERGKIIHLPANVALGLFDPDEFQDVAVSYGDTVRVYRNLGNGLFGADPAWWKVLAKTVDRMQWRKSRRIDRWLVDPDSWGDLEVAYDDGTRERISHREMMPQVSLIAPAKRSILDPPLTFHEVWRSETQPANANKTQLGDVDHDGRIEVGYWFYPESEYDSTNRFVVYENIGNDAYEVDWDTVFYGGGGPYALTDIDEDGHFEWVVLAVDGVSLLECYGDGLYRFYHTNIQFPYPSRPGQAIFRIHETDVDHDGVKELSVLNSDGSLTVDETLIFIGEFVVKGEIYMGFNVDLARYDVYCPAMVIGQIDGAGWDEIVPGNGGFGVDEPIPIDYLWCSGIPGPFAWEVRGIETGLRSGSTAPLFVNLDSDSTQELVIGGVGPIGHGSVFALDHIVDTVYELLWVDSSLISAPLRANAGMLDGDFVIGEANSWQPNYDTTWSQLHVYYPGGVSRGTWFLDSASIQQFHFVDIDSDAVTNLVFAHLSQLPARFLADFEIDTVTSIGEEPPQLPGEYRLLQNYPNPFNPVTWIEFSIPEKGQTSLEVFDVTGRLVGVLINGVLDPGRYRASWEGAALSSGVYFYRLKSGHYSNVKKLILLK
jgi:hypothetical protein